MKYVVVLYTSIFMYLCPSAVEESFHLSQARPADAVVFSVPCDRLRNNTSNDNVYQHHLPSRSCLSFQLLVACTGKI